MKKLSERASENMELLWINEAENHCFVLSRLPGYIYIEDSKWNLFDDGCLWNLDIIRPSHRELPFNYSSIRILELFKDII